VPDVAVVSTIPYLGSPAQSMPPAYASSKYEKLNFVRPRGAFTLLFDAGDSLSPAPAYQDLAAFLASLRCRAFRGAAWVTGARVYIDGNQAVGAQFRWDVRVGETPPPSSWHNRRILSHFDCLTGVGQVGPGRNRPKLVAGPHGAFNFVLGFGFKLCTLLDVGQLWFTRHRVPWAWLTLNYGIHWSPLRTKYLLLIEGSHLPSQYPYFDWQAQSPIYDMMSAQQHDIHGFIEACGNPLMHWCCSAPGRSTKLRITRQVP
jgi:hypothetical protein